jgi:hypothetical protein
MPARDALTPTRAKMSERFWSSAFPRRPAVVLDALACLGRHPEQLFPEARHLALRRTRRLADLGETLVHLRRVLDEHRRSDRHP